MTERLILIRHSGLRAVTEHEILKTLDSTEQALPREIVHVDTMGFADDADAGDWERSAVHLREQAAAIQRAANVDTRAVDLRYFGLAEIPHGIALGAFLGDERFVRVTDYERHGKEWVWVETGQTLALEAAPLPREKLTQAGMAVVRVAISAAISDADVEAAVGRETLADVTITPADGRVPEVGLVRSLADVEHARSKVREAMSAIFAARPGVEVVHLFVAAPVSVCFVIGQELHLRSTVPVQTYRFRRSDTELSYTPAIRLTAAGGATAAAALTPEDIGRAQHVREIWKDALEAVQTYAASREKEPLDPPNVWYGTLRLGDAIAQARPFPALPCLWQVVDARDTVDPLPYGGDYGHDKDQHLWRLGDRLLLGLADAARDDATLQRLIQLFLFHEYLHEHNALTKYTAQQVGSFPNCLEHIDYAADLYALLHQLGWTEIYDRKAVGTDEKRCEFLAQQIDLIIRSFWAFDRPFPRDEWQVRRLRRYLNWYWRHVQVKRAAPNLAVTLLTLARRPAIELAGMRQRAIGLRVFADLTKTIPGTDLSLALVVEDERLMRVSNSVVTNLGKLLDAFRSGDHAAIQQFFNAVFEEAKNWNGALPRIA